MPQTDALTAAAANRFDDRVIPMFVCAGCRPEPLGYASIEYGDQLDEIVACPMRDVCTWHAAHDLGGSCQYNEQPEGALLTPLFRKGPYFSCPNFDDFWSFASSGRAPRIPREIAPAHVMPAAALIAPAAPTSA